MKRSQKLEKLSDVDLIQEYSKLISLMKKKGILKSKNTVGDVGKLYAIDVYSSNPDLPNLTPVQGVQNINAMSKEGKRYCIKSTTKALIGAFYGLNLPDSEDPEEKKFEYVVIVLMNEDFGLLKVLELTWEQFLEAKKWSKAQNGWNISVTKSLLAEAKTVFAGDES